MNCSTKFKLHLSMDNQPSKFRQAINQIGVVGKAKNQSVVVNVYATLTYTGSIANQGTTMFGVVGVASNSQLKNIYADYIKNENDQFSGNNFEFGGIVGLLINSTLISSSTGGAANIFTV